MARLSDSSQIWKFKPTREDRYLGARYAGISLFWTYDRMDQEDATAKGTRNRAFNIAKGLVGQRALQRELDEREVTLEVEEKSHRETDSYDLHFPTHSKISNLDIKTFNHFTNYGVPQKPELSTDLIAENLGYEGPEWGHFFPLLIPYDQFSQSKDVYCFGISSSIDYRDQLDRSESYELYAFPDLETRIGQFVTNDVIKREKNGLEFSLKLRLNCNTEVDSQKIKVIGEYDGDIKEGRVEVDASGIIFGPLTGVNSIKIGKEVYDLMDIEDLTLDVTIESRNIEIVPSSARWHLGAKDFHNLLMPMEFTFYFLGWIRKSEFKERAQNRLGWKEPSSEAFIKNRLWQNPSRRDKRFLRGNNLDWTLDSNNGVVGAIRQNAGCYYYPKINSSNMEYGGLRKTNLYVLPEDLRPMDEL